MAETPNGTTTDNATAEGRAARAGCTALDRNVIAGAQAILAALYQEVQDRKAGTVPASCVSTELYTAAVNLALCLANAGHEVPLR